MTGVLLRKLLRDARLPLVVAALLLGAFQCLWAKITSRILGELSPFFSMLAASAGKNITDIQEAVFKGPGQLIRTLIGGERVDLERAMDMLSIGYVHPLVQTILCIWAIGRASGALAGEIDRGTMELLLAQPLSRTRLVVTHFLLDLIVIPVLCLSLWAGTCVGVWLVGPIVLEPPEGKEDLKPPEMTYTIEVGPLKYTMKGPPPTAPESEEQRNERLHVDLAAFGPALWAVGGLLFAMSGYTMWLSSLGRFRWRVLGLAVLVTLVQFLVNLVGQLWEPLERFRPCTIFYYYQPQDLILGRPWTTTLPPLLVLYGVGLVGYLLALWTFRCRDLPAPL
jgi:ABC-2 type transport system permease protein